MKNKLNKKKGYGSFFSYEKHNSKAFINFNNSFIPTNKKLFYTGRQAIKYIVEIIKLNNKINTFWIPEYYCQHVTIWLKKNYDNIKSYKVNPLDNEYIIKANDFVKENDIILVNNFWGTSNCSLNYINNKVIVIEDHSHGWLSNSCIESTADYCFASLRKSVPAPLGGIAWIPNEDKLIILNQKSSNDFNKIWNNTFLGMTKKLEFEENILIDKGLKNDFIALINNAENMMHHNYDLVKLNSKHKKIIESYLKINYLDFKALNFKTIISLIKPNNTFEIINGNSTPFGLILHFKNINKLNYFKSYLISKNIYPSQLWPNNKLKYGYFINIHIDYRYNDLDMYYIAQIINAF